MRTKFLSNLFWQMILQLTKNKKTKVDLQLSFKKAPAATGKMRMIVIVTKIIILTRIILIKQIVKQSIIMFNKKRILFKKRCMKLTN